MDIREIYSKCAAPDAFTCPICLGKKRYRKKDITIIKNWVFIETMGEEICENCEGMGALILSN